MPEGREKTLKIVDCTQVYRGVNTHGHSYTIFEIRATQTDGIPINEKLRSFESLPIGRVVKVKVVPFESQKHGRSFTLHPVNGEKRDSQEQINELRTELERQADMIRRMREEFQIIREHYMKLARGAAVGTVPVAEELAQQETELDARFGSDAPW